MPTFIIPVSWSVSSNMEIEAECLDDAIAEAEDAELPENTEYLEGSFQVDHEFARLLNRKKIDK